MNLPDFGEYAVLPESSTTPAALKQRLGMKNLQRELSSISDKRIIAAQPKRSPEHERIVQSTSRRCFTAIPGRDGGGLFKENELSVLLQLYLGILKKYTFAGSNELGKCKDHTYDNHSLLSCKDIKTFRHNESSKAFGMAVNLVGLHGPVSANAAKSFPVPHLDKSKPGHLEPADIAIQDLTHKYIDMHILDVNAVSNRTLDIEEVLRRGWARKSNKYAAACDKFGVDFDPFVVTQGGMISSKSFHVLNECLGIKKIKPVPGEPTPPLSFEEKRRMKIKSDFMTSLSFACNSWAARSILDHRIMNTK